MPYLPRSHARLLGYINEEDHVAKSKLAKIPKLIIVTINLLFLKLLQ